MLNVIKMFSAIIVFILLIVFLVIFIADIRREESSSFLFVLMLLAFLSGRTGRDVIHINRGFNIIDGDLPNRLIKWNIIGFGISLLFFEAYKILMQLGTPLSYNVAVIAGYITGIVLASSFSGSLLCLSLVFEKKSV